MEAGEESRLDVEARLRRWMVCGGAVGDAAPAAIDEIDDGSVDEAGLDWANGAWRMAPSRTGPLTPLPHFRDCRTVHTVACRRRDKHQVHQALRATGLDKADRHCYLRSNNSEVKRACPLLHLGAPPPARLEPQAQPCQLVSRAPCLPLPSLAATISPQSTMPKADVFPMQMRFLEIPTATGRLRARTWLTDRSLIIILRTRYGTRQVSRGEGGNV